MNWLLLRGQVPTDRPPEQIMFDTLDECDDMWTHLLSRIVRGDDYGEIWYWGGNRTHKWRENLVERWIPSFKNSQFDFDPNVIIARGGFKQYDPVLFRNNQADRIYYGAGKRFYPICDFKDYDFILVDNSYQLSRVMEIIQTSRCDIFPKPASENIFKPQPKVRSQMFDVIVVGNWTPNEIKDITWILDHIPSDIRVVHCGIPSERTKNRSVHSTGWIERKRLPFYYMHSSVAVVCAHRVDSGPRVISEALACNRPVLLHERTVSMVSGFGDWGMRFRDDNFEECLRKMLSDQDRYQPRGFYDDEFSLETVSDLFREDWLS